MRFAPPALGIKFAAITADSQVGFSTWISSERKGFTHPTLLVGKSHLLEEKHLGFLKNPHVFEEKNSVVC